MRHSAHITATQTNTTSSGTILDGLENPAVLTMDNWLQFANWCHHFILITEATFHLDRDGIIPASVHDKECQRAVALLESPGGSQWWRAGARTQFADDFVASLERAMAAKGTIVRYDFAPGRGFFPHGADPEPSAPTQPATQPES